VTKSTAALKISIKFVSISCSDLYIYWVGIPVSRLNTKISATVQYSRISTLYLSVLLSGYALIYCISNNGKLLTQLTINFQNFVCTNFHRGTGYFAMKIRIFLGGKLLKARNPDNG
jgi:hypothetical protein